MRRVEVHGVMMVDVARIVCGSGGDDEAVEEVDENKTKR